MHGAGALALATVVLLVTACGAAKVRPAPFRARPDSVDAGSLLGPFDGKVVDAGSGDPVSGALVYATWTFQSGTAMQAPSGFREAVTSTDGGGRYRLSALDGLPRGGRVADFYLVIYKRGYVAYRSDRRFDDLGARLDFAQRQNQVRLEKWRSDFSHVRHLRFVGGGPAIAALTRWETQEASAELSGVKAGPRVAADLVVGGAGGLAAALVLTEQDIRSITGFDGTFETGPLNDEPDTDLYSSQHFRALGQPETFDVALRVWKLDSKSADERYAELLTTLPQVKQVNEIADKSMRATESQIFGVGFVDIRRGVVVLMTCGQSQCKSIDVLVALGRKAHENIRRQVGEDGGSQGGPGPAGTTPGEPGSGQKPEPTGPDRSKPARPSQGLRPTPAPPRPSQGPLPAPPATAPTTPSPLPPQSQPTPPADKRQQAPRSQDATP
ncbi:MAG TPA: carboxypeptidase-like regulatory domain-containing protein [Kofleriaceae bacterium]|nr:carboxypeptidase-like regulatory domain-containing protein [Kofleriaceae bacterium]